MQHELLNHEFQQGHTLKAQPDEPAVQRWIADRLDLKKGIAYSVDREPHVADEKEPDVRLRAKASNASLPIEIKLTNPDGWTLQQLEDALRIQLAGRYLRDRNAHHGILLLVRQESRQKGWKDTKTNTFIDFDEVVIRLKELALEIAIASPDAPVCEIVVLDVSSCGEAK